MEEEKKIEEEEFDHTAYLREKLFDVVSSLNLIEPVFTKYTYHRIEAQRDKLEKLLVYLDEIVY